MKKCAADLACWSIQPAALIRFSEAATALGRGNSQFAGESTMNILIVEDHQDTRRVLSTLLGRADHEVISASGETEALQLLANMRVNVLLSDLGLQDGDGIDLVAKAKTLQPRIKAIALTARSSAKDQERGRKAGFDYYLTKPFDFHELRTLLSVLKKAA